MSSDELVFYFLGIFLLDLEDFRSSIALFSYLKIIINQAFY